MNVLNIHERQLPVSADQAGLDTLASRDDALWPVHSWPRVKFDRPLAIGAAGGHGPIRYTVEAYIPGRSIRLRFTAPRGFDGHHRFEVIEVPAGAVVLRHTIEMKTRGRALITWPVIFRPLHDALLEDLLATAEASVGEPPVMRKWSPWVRLLRRILSGGKKRPQVVPPIAEESVPPQLAGGFQNQSPLGTAGKSAD